MEKLKAEIFDLIKEQDILKLRYAEIEKTKQAKLIQLKELEMKKEK